LLDFDGGRVRTAIPTALAPRYGNAAAAVAAHQVPGTDITAHYPLTMNLVVRGELARAPISSPTHTLTQMAGADTVALSLGPKAALDRDLVILIDRAQAPSQALVARDGDSYVALATVTAPPTATDEVKPRNLKLLVDCSGSMEGDSIGQASEALRTIVGSLTSHDKVSLTRFGSQVDPITRGLETVTLAVRAKLALRIATMRADLGGTEIAAAIESVIAIPVPKDAAADVLLITDGEVWELDALLASLAEAGHRLFVIAVGTAPVEELGRKVASATGGACEFVTPGEDMRGAVARQLGRMGTPPATVTGVDWSETPEWSVGVGQFVFPGDTVHVFAAFRERPRNALRVTIGGAASVATVTCTWPDSVAAGDTLARIAAARRLPGLETEAAAELAEKYSLVTAQTSCVVVLVRPDGEKTQGLPALRAVPQMMAAGWGGAGSVMLRAAPSLPADVMESARECFSMSIPRGPRKRPGRIVPPLPMYPESPNDVDTTIVERLEEFVANAGHLPSTLADLGSLGVEPQILASLQMLIDQGHREQDIVVAWLAESMSRSQAGAVDPRLLARLSRAAVRPLRTLVAGMSP
jgi:Ca-activated chloride channel family protein